MNFHNIKLHGNIWLLVEFPVLSPPNFIHTSCIFSWNTSAHTITILFLNNHWLIRREDWTLQVKFSKISKFPKISKFTKFPKINPSEYVWIWLLFFVQGFIKAYYLKTRMCCWEQKQGGLELVDFHISNSNAQWQLLESWHLSVVSTKLFSSPFKKKLGYLA